MIKTDVTLGLTLDKRENKREEVFDLREVTAREQKMWREGGGRDAQVYTRV